MEINDKVTSEEMRGRVVREGGQIIGNEFALAGGRAFSMIDRNYYNVGKCDSPRAEGERRKEDSKKGMVCRTCYAVLADPETNRWINRDGNKAEYDSLTEPYINGERRRETDAGYCPRHEDDIAKLKSLPVEEIKEMLKVLRLERK